MRLTLSISPCPNDTFMFDALMNGRIDTRGLEFDLTFADIEQLNTAVMAADGAASVALMTTEGTAPAPLIRGCPDDAPNAPGTSAKPHVSKISYAVLPAIADRYRLLDSGSALGHGNGPLLVARPGFSVNPTARVAIPGEHTTANMLLKRLFPQLTDRRPMLFSDIAPAVASDEFDAGVLIHEGRFTYRDHGLELVADLGAEWDRATGGLPLPLGAIVASRALPPEIVKTVEELIRQSVEYAFAHPAASREFVKAHAREMDDAVIDSHIALFVNRNSLTLDAPARRAVRELTGIETE